MKKILTIAFIILFTTALFGCVKEESLQDIQITLKKNMEEIILEVPTNSSKDVYRKNSHYKKIIKKGHNAALALEDLYYKDELDDTTALVAALAIEEIHKCNLKEKYNLNWTDPKDFFELWKTNNCSTEQEKRPRIKASTLEKYPDLANTLKSYGKHIPILDTMTPQGLTIMKDYTIITAYEPNKEKNSECYVLNSKGEIVNIVSLDTNSHVGAIAHDQANNLIWIPSNNGIINAYDATEFLEKKAVTYRYSFENLSDGLLYYKNSKKKHVAYLTVDDDYLYIGSFLASHNCTIKKFKISKTSEEQIELTFIDEFKVPPQVQSLTFYKNGDDRYLLLSTSFGRKNSSYLHVYKYDESIKDYSKETAIKKLTLPPMLEQITAYNDELHILFESNAKKYSDCEDKIEKKCVLSIDKILSD